MGVASTQGALQQVLGNYNRKTRVGRSSRRVCDGPVMPTPGFAAVSSARCLPRPSASNQQPVAPSRSEEGNHSCATPRPHARYLTLHQKAPATSWFVKKLQGLRLEALCWEFAACRISQYRLYTAAIERFRSFTATRALSWRIMVGFTARHGGTARTWL